MSDGIGRLPWPSDVEVEEETPERVVLSHGPATAEIRKDGIYDLRFKSEEMTLPFMFLDDQLTEDVLKALSGIPPERWFEWLKLWAQPHPTVTFRRGRVVREEPKREGAPVRIGALGADDTENWADQHYKGSRFMYVHLVFHDGEEGAAIMWDRGDHFTDPEIYTGDFEGFMQHQSVDAPDEPETWAEHDWEFDNGFSWAMERMGSFDEPGRIAPLALDAFKEDPSMLLPESVEKMRHRLDDYPPQLQEAVREWLESA